jgi:hypothetical protein
VQVRKRPPVGRMYFARPSEGERFYLRLLLHHVPGAVSFGDLCTINRNTPAAVEQSSFRAACQAMGLLQDDGEWRQCLAEATTVSFLCSLRVADVVSG